MTHAMGCLVASIALGACGAPASSEPVTSSGDEAATPAPVPDLRAAGERCPEIVAESSFERAVEGAHRACAEDADCASVRLDCSNLRCTAVHREHAARYAEPLECAGYPGGVGNYDCMPQFTAERPVCMDGCCTSERRLGRATGEEACGAIESTYAASSCTVFGPTFSVDPCLADVASIRAEADEAGLRRLQHGLDCARGASTCAQIELCVRQFRGIEHRGAP